MVVGWVRGRGSGVIPGTSSESSRLEGGLVGTKTVTVRTSGERAERELIDEQGVGVYEKLSRRGRGR